MKDDVLLYVKITFTFSKWKEKYTDDHEKSFIVCIIPFIIVLLFAFKKVEKLPSFWLTCNCHWIFIGNLRRIPKNLTIC